MGSQYARDLGVALAEVQRGPVVGTRLRAVALRQAVLGTAIRDVTNASMQLQRQHPALASEAEAENRRLQQQLEVERNTAAEKGDRQHDEPHR